MTSYIIKRLLLMIPTLFAICLVTFVVLNLAPGTPGQAQFGQGQESGRGASSESFRIFKEQFNLDKPVLLNTRYTLGKSDVEPKLELLADAARPVCSPNQEQQNCIQPEDRPSSEAVIDAQTSVSDWDDYIVPELHEIARTHDRLGVRRIAVNKLADNAQYTLVSAYASELTTQEEAVNERRSNVNNRIESWRVPRDASAKQIDKVLEEKWSTFLNLHEIDVESKLETLTRGQLPVCGEETSENCIDEQQKPTESDVEAASEWLATWGVFVIPELYRIAESHPDTSVRYTALDRLTESSLPDTLTSEGIDERLSEIPKPFFAIDDNRFAYNSSERFYAAFMDTRFAKYIGNLASLNFGISHVDKQPVMGTIWVKLKYTVSMSFLSIFLSFLISVPLGVWSAYNQNTVADQIVTAVLLMLYSLPTFFAAVLLLEFFATGDPFNVFPLGGFVGDNPEAMTTAEYLSSVLWHLCLPVFCLTYFSLATLSRYARTGILDVIRADYIRTARAKGLSESMVIIKHAVRNGMIPILTLLGTQLPRLIGGSIVLEVVFGIPGMGEYLFESITLRDYNAIMAVLLCSAVLTLVGILISDISYAVVDPRISFD